MGRGLGFVIAMDGMKGNFGTEEGNHEQLEAEESSSVALSWMVEYPEEICLEFSLLMHVNGKMDAWSSLLFVRDNAMVHRSDQV
jgi:hypothetical protein